jgi:hypothetical protein
VFKVCFTPCILKARQLLYGSFTVHTMEVPRDARVVATLCNPRFISNECGVSVYIYEYFFLSRYKWFEMPKQVGFFECDLSNLDITNFTMSAATSNFASFRRDSNCKSGPTYLEKGGRKWCGERKTPPSVRYKLSSKF